MSPSIATPAITPSTTTLNRKELVTRALAASMAYAKEFNVGGGHINVKNFEEYTAKGFEQYTDAELLALIAKISKPATPAGKFNALSEAERDALVASLPEVSGNTTNELAALMMKFGKDTIVAAYRYKERTPGTPRQAYLAAAFEYELDGRTYELNGQTYLVQTPAESGKSVSPFSPAGATHPWTGDPDATILDRIEAQYPAAKYRIERGSAALGYDYVAIAVDTGKNVAYFADRMNPGATPHQRRQAAKATARDKAFATQAARREKFNALPVKERDAVIDGLDAISRDATKSANNFINGLEAGIRTQLTTVVKTYGKDIVLAALMREVYSSISTDATINMQKLVEEGL